MDISEMGSFGERCKLRIRISVFLTLFLIFFLSAYGQILAQTVLLYEDWSEVEADFPQGWSESRVGFSDWFIDNGTLGIPVCDIAGSSEGNFVMALDYDTSTYALYYQYINTTGYSNITIKWNAYRMEASLPLLTFE